VALLTQASREEVQALKPKLIEADKTLLLGLSHYFRAMADIESVDFEAVDAKVLRGSAEHFASARKELEASLKAGRAALELGKKIKNSEGFQARLLAVDADIEAFDKTIRSIHTRVSAGNYPKARECADVAAAFLKVVTPFERNALVELGAYEQRKGK
jgi:hypothetical protein